MTTFTDKFLQQLGVRHPLIVAPMAGGPSSVELIVASCEAGALGSMGAAYSSGTALTDFASQVQARTRKPFAINLFIPSKLSAVSERELHRAIEATKQFRDELSLPVPVLQPPYEENFDEQFEAAISLRPRVLSFVFGLLSPEQIKEAKRFQILLVGTATTLEEFLALQDSGVDAVVAQGVQAGGHRGIFDAAAEDPQIETLNLVAEIKPKALIPVIAAGGIMNAKGIRGAFAVGADAVQMGTAFLATKEAGTGQAYREALLKTAQRETRLTRAFSGRLARGLVNRFMTEMDAKSESILPFPAQNKFTRDLRNASAAANSAEYLSLWSGSGVGTLWTGTTRELIEQLFAENP